ncbi:hypothetical protein RF11_15375 [Thelohanellus kitauei]|uniref:Uncharacterized protein n=1 Tax=Thelohanellus kitauei TaxID=669202 RepID=A0A0C2I559_THEKT|nr:hypothetical protein RF11_15375 [Thelohanellus kitauei]
MENKKKTVFIVNESFLNQPIMKKLEENGRVRISTTNFQDTIIATSISLVFMIKKFDTLKEHQVLLDSVKNLQKIHPKSYLILYGNNIDFKLIETFNLAMIESNCFITVVTVLDEPGVVDFIMNIVNIPQNQFDDSVTELKNTFAGALSNDDILDIVMRNFGCDKTTACLLLSNIDSLSDLWDLEDPNKNFQIDQKLMNSIIRFFNKDTMI